MANSNWKQRWRLLAIIVVLLGLGGWKLRGMFSNVGYSPVQPIPFSHRLHAGINHIPCMYCHAGVERGKVSPIPALNVCMGCHSVVDANLPVIQRIAAAYNSGKPFHWVRIYALPRFVKFNHQPHIEAGVACQTCHGPVQTMSQVYQYKEFWMGQCINCHRARTYLPSPRDRAHRDLAYFHGREVNAPTDCNTCHN